jgi:chromosome condensin MukBEF ATPase and DNA-binding subunit MukB
VTREAFLAKARTTRRKDRTEQQKAVIKLDNLTKKMQKMEREYKRARAAGAIAPDPFFEGKPA